MSKIKGATPFKTWLVWSIAVLGAFLIITWPYFIKGMVTDESKVSFLIIAFFLYGFTSSLLAALRLQKEHTSLTQSMNAQEVVKDETQISDIFLKIRRQLTSGKQVNLRSLLAAYSAKINCRIQNVSVTSGMLITIGLLGTVIGLINAISGLGTVLEFAGIDQGKLLSGLNATIGGMGTALYTTFFGALLGGVVLKVLAAELKKSATQLAADALEFGELYIMPLASADANKTLDEIQARIHVLKDHLNSFQDCFSETGSALSQFSSTLSQSLAAITESVKSVSSSLESGNSELKDSFTAAGEVITTGAQQMTRETDGVFKEIRSTFSQNIAGINGAMVSVCDTLTTSNETLKVGLTDAGETIRTGISDTIKSVSETVDTSKEELKASLTGAGESIADGAKQIAQETSSAFKQFNNELGQNLNAINESIVASSNSIEAGNKDLLDSFSTAKEAIHDSAREISSAVSHQNNELIASLKGLNDTVLRTNNDVHNMASKRLSTQEADLAKKLNAAAALFQGLTASPDATDETFTTEV